MSTRIKVTIATTMAASLFCCRPLVAFTADSHAPGTEGGGGSDSGLTNTGQEAQRLDRDGNYVESIAEYEHYVRVSDDSGLAHYALGCELVKQGNTAPIKLVEG